MAVNRIFACRLPFALALSFVLALALSTVAMAQRSSVNFQTRFTGQVDCETPIPLKNIPISWQVTGVLNADGSGTADLLGTAFVLSTTIHFEGRLGARPAASPGGTTQVRVAGPHTLLLIWNLPNNQFVTRITVAGQSCTGGFEAKLKPGKSQYTIFDGSGFQYCGRPRVEGTSCEVH